MHEVWYRITTQTTVNEIKDYNFAKRAAANGAKVETIYKYKDLDRAEINEKRKEKILKKFF